MTHDQNVFFPDTASRIAHETWLTEHLASVLDAKTTTFAKPRSDAWRAELAAFDFATPKDLRDVANWTTDALSEGIVHMTSPGYLGLFNPQPTFPAEFADRIASGFNPQICVYSHAPAAVEIEEHTIRAVGQRIGFKETFGHFTSGGAEANETAVLCALTQACPAYSEAGIHAFNGAPRLYVSAESHLAWLKIAHATGIGRRAVRLVSTDGNGRMDADALTKAIAADREAGNVPFMVAATAGTTNAGMIDPLPQLIEIARREQIWAHVDAAWAGALIAHPEHAKALAGIEAADSVTIDAHKWFSTTMGAGMFLTSVPDILAETFRVAASYMPEGEPARDTYITSNLWSRRFVGLRLFMAFAAGGWEAYADLVAHGIEMSNRLATGLTVHGWQHVNASPAAVVCMTPPSGPEAVIPIAKALEEDGRFWLSRAVYEGGDVLRACITNGRTSVEHIDMLIDTLVALGRTS